MQISSFWIQKSSFNTEFIIFTHTDEVVCVDDKDLTLRDAGQGGSAALSVFYVEIKSLQ